MKNISHRPDKNLPAMMGLFNFRSYACTVYGLCISLFFAVALNGKDYGCLIIVASKSDGQEFND